MTYFPPFLPFFKNSLKKIGFKELFNVFLLLKLKKHGIFKV